MVDDWTLKNRIAHVMTTDGPNADNLAIAICTYLSSHPERPENDPDDETGWGEWVSAQYERVMTRILTECRRDSGRG